MKRFLKKFIDTIYIKIYEIYGVYAVGYVLHNTCIKNYLELLVYVMFDVSAK